MMTETSAGGVVVRKAQNRWEVLLLRDMNGNWTFPKGLIDPGETKEQAAIREIKEEVGIMPTIANPLDTIEYWYQREGQKIHKTVHYFLCEYNGDETLTPQTEEGVSEVKWVSVDEAVDLVGYPKTNKALLEKAKFLISKS